jgi:hypothetical protein
MDRTLCFLPIREQELVIDSHVDLYFNIENLPIFFEHASGVHTPVGTSDTLTKDSSSVMLPTRGMRYCGPWSGWTSLNLCFL